MALNINTNIGALGAAAAASSVNKSMETSMERLSTGLRVNTAADDAAGVAIGSRLTAEIRGTNQAIRNAMDGQAMIDTAEGAHNEITNILQRMRELAVQAANDTNSADDRTSLQNEINALTSEIDRIAVATTWAGKALLNGAGTPASPATAKASTATFNFHVGSGANGDGGAGGQDKIGATIHAVTAKAIGVASSGTTAPSALVKVSESDATVPNNMAVDQSLGTITFSGALADGDTFKVNIDGHEVTFAYTETTDKYDDNLLGLTHAAKDAIDAKGIAGLNVALNAGTNKLTLTYGSGVDVSSSSLANTAVSTIDTAIKTINSQRASLGAISNRLDNSVANLTNIATNLEAGRSRILDADFAAESTNLAKSQILQQASMAMLAQANASKQGVLQLLQG